MASILPQIFRRSQAPNGATRYSVTLSMPVFFALSAVFLLITVWSFYLGYMVGRGQNPEKHLEEIAGILQAHQKENMPIVPATPAPSAQTADASQADQPAEAKDKADPAVVPVPAPGQAPQAQAQAQPQQKPQAQKPQQKPQQAQQKPQQKPQASKDPRYSYTFQLAALRSEQAAKQAAANAQKRGIRCSVQKSGKVWLVMASVRGTEKDAQNLRSQSKAAGLGSPLLVSRKEIR